MGRQRSPLFLRGPVVALFKSEHLCSSFEERARWLCRRQWRIVLRDVLFEQRSHTGQN